MLTNEQITSIIAKVQSTCGNHTPISIVYSARKPKRIAEASDGGVITIFCYVWDILTDEQQHNTIVHEACHILALKMFGWSAWGHTPDWKRLMALCGCPTKTRYTTPLSIDQAQKISPYVLQCKCGASVILGKIQYGRFQKGNLYRCGRCRGELKK